MDWVDSDNFGISHVGIPPKKLPRDNIIFDIFHLRSAITRKLMNYLRKFMLLQTPEIMDRFEFEVLTKIWKVYHIMVWTFNKNFNTFKGEEILSFIKNTDLVVSFMNMNFEMTDNLTNLCMALELWSNIICPFLHITKIEDKDSYKNYIVEFE